MIFSLRKLFYVTIIGKEHLKQLELPENEFGVNEAQKHENPALEKPKTPANINFRTQHSTSLMAAFGI